jgi:hypothetical protein
VFADLLKGKAKWDWNGEHESAFLNIREVLKKPLVNMHFNEDLPLILQTDASNGGIAGILIQGEELIFAVSRSLKPEEQRYAAIERELLAVCFSIERLSRFLKGRFFTVRTDHKPLLGVLRNDGFTSDRLSRLAVRLLDYIFDVEYVKGEENFTGFLSRSTVEDLYTYVEFKENENGSQILVLHKGEWFTYIRSGVRRSILSDMHSQTHLGKTKMLEALKEKRVHWPSIVKDVEEFLQSCTCLLKKENRKKSRVMHHFSEEDKKGLLCMDIYMYNGCSYLTILDVECNRLFVLRLEDKTLDEVQSMFESFWDSMPLSFKQRIKILLTDNGKEFQFDEGFVPELKRMKTSVYHPQGNSFLERKHLEISKQCRIHGVDPDKLEESVINSKARVLNVDLAVRYVPKSRRVKSEDVWRFVENLGSRNKKTNSIIAKDLISKRITYLHKDDYKIVQRPVITSWKINPMYLDIVKDFDLDFSLQDFSIPDFNVSWKKKNIFADLDSFVDLHEILDKAKRDSAKNLVFILPEWEETSVCKRINEVPAELLKFEPCDDLCLCIENSNFPVGKLNFEIWIGWITEFDYDYFENTQYSSDWGGIL